MRIRPPPRKRLSQHSKRTPRPTNRNIHRLRKTHRRANHSVSYSRSCVGKDKRPYFLVVDMGTFCDHRLFDTAVVKLRQRYRLIYITDSSHKLPPADTKMTYTVPPGMLEHPGEIASIMMEASFFGKVSQIVQRFVRTREALFLQIRAMMHTLTTMIQAAIDDYRPRGVLVHSGCVAQVLAANRLDVPTTALYFAPGFLPCREVPFTFDNVLTEPQTEVWAEHQEQVRANVHSGLRYHEELQKRMPLSARTAPFEHLRQIQHVYTFGPPLVPPMTYADILPPLTIKSVGLMEPNLPTTPLDNSLAEWVCQVKKDKNKLIFVSFGSYLNNLAVHRPNNKLPSTLVLLLIVLQQYGEDHHARVLLHDDKNIVPEETVKYIHEHLPLVRIHTTFVAYPTLIPKCSLVCFTGSVCLQNICWKHKCPMLYVPVLPEQFLWAKLYQKHTHVPYIDYQRATAQTMKTCIRLAFSCVKEKNVRAFFRQVEKTILPDVEGRLVECVDEWGP